MGSKIASDATTLDRVIAMLAALSLFCVFLLPSQSGASFPTYLLALLAPFARSDRWAFSESRILAGLLVALLIYFSSSVWWSTEHPFRSVLSIYSRSVLIVTFVVALSASLARFPDFMSLLSRGLAVSGGVAALAALIYAQLRPTWDGRLVGLGQLHNSVVAALAFDVALLFALSSSIAKAGGWRVIGCVCAAVLGLAVLATGSRNGYFAGSVGVGVLIATSWRPLSSRRTIWFTAAILGAGAFGASLLEIRPEWLATVFPRGDSFRVEIWGAEWQRLIAHGLWFGLGILTRDDVSVAGQNFSHPHSLYLASALQGGLVGLLILLSLLAYAGVRLLHAVRLREGRLGLAVLATGMSAYLVDGWELIDKVGLSWLLLWVPLAIAMAVGVIPKTGSTRGMMVVDMAERSSDSIGERM